MATEKTEIKEEFTADTLVDCFIPEDDEDRNFVPVTVNGVRYNIKKGETVKVPAYIKRALQDMARARKESKARIRAKKAND